MEVFIRDHRYPNLRASFGRRATGMPAAGATYPAALLPGVLGELPARPPLVEPFPKALAEEFLPGIGGRFV